MESDKYLKYHHRLLRRISIHALRMESDKIIFFNLRIFSISIHALRMESDIQ